MTSLTGHQFCDDDDDDDNGDGSVDGNNDHV